MNNPFQIARSDGRSDGQILVDLAAKGEPGKVYTFAEIIGALSVGSTRAYDIASVRSVVARSYGLVLRECRRALHSVRGVGYRIAEASDHDYLARNRKRRSEVQMRRGLLTLQHVRWEEMGAASRAAHEGTLMIVSAIVAQQTALEKRQAKTEDLIRKLLDKPTAG